MAINEAVNQQYEKVNEKLGNILKKKTLMIVFLMDIVKKNYVI